MRFNTLLLSSAALLATGTVGLAADLPSKKAAPVEYVRVCSQFGAGFFYIPGSDTCLKVGGRVRADYYYNEPLSRESNATSTRARGYLSLDSFTATDWGPVRATTRVFVTRDSGRVTSGSGAPGGTTLPNGTDANVTLDYAYIQFAGITAGRIGVSMFEFAPLGGVSYAGGNALGRGSDYGSINILAYTATFGGGFSATVSLEDGSERRVGIGNVGDNYKLLSGGQNQPTYGGHAVPDIVGRLDYTGAWGAAALTAAVHQTRVGSPGTTTRAWNATTSTVDSANANSYADGAVGDTKYGFAIQGGVKINLPMIAAGDALFLQAAYADGASSYTGWATSTAGSISVSAYDALYDGNGKGHTSKSYSIVGGVLHYWVPTLRQGLFAGYGKLDQYGKYYDAAAVTVGTNLIWSPVKNLDIGAEVGYQKLTDVPNAVTIKADTHKDNYFGRLRFQRDF